MTKKKIFRIAIGDTRGHFVGFKLAEGRSVKEIANQRPVGKGRKVIAILPTRMHGTLKHRLSLSRSKRFGKEPW
jgi:hypothetical protein